MKQLTKKEAARQLRKWMNEREPVPFEDILREMPGERQDRIADRAEEIIKASDEDS